jgi:hypothetical protein
VNIAGERML